MLTLTDAAADVINDLASQPDLPETAGLRIWPGPEDPQGPALSAGLTPGPGPQDKVIESHHARVYLEPAVAERLADKVLDADTTDEGEIAFHVRSQEGIG